MKQKIILDTDIGDDIDDAYALAFILASPELDLVGVSTVFRNTRARARQAKTILKLAGREDIPVAVGCGTVLSPKLSYDDPDLAHGHVSLDFVSRYWREDIPPNQNPSALPWEELTPPHALHGVDFLIQSLLEGDGDIVPVTIGPMSNLAMALLKEPSIAKKIPRILTMGGAIYLQRAEWNIRADPVAAAIVFNSRIPLTLVPNDVTFQCRLSRRQLARLHDAEQPVARNLSSATKAWPGRLPLLHDPLAIETMIEPNLVETRNGTVSVELSGDAFYGYTLLVPSEDGSGPHTVCLKVKARAACELWLERVLTL